MRSALKNNRPRVGSTESLQFSEVVKYLNDSHTCKGLEHNQLIAVISRVPLSYLCTEVIDVYYFELKNEPSIRTTAIQRAPYYRGTVIFE